LKIYLSPAARAQLQAYLMPALIMIHPCCNFDRLDHLEKELSLGRLNRNKTKKQKKWKTTIGSV
jgi:hypothetical protein